MIAFSPVSHVWSWNQDPIVIVIIVSYIIVFSIYTYLYIYIHYMYYNISIYTYIHIMYTTFRLQLEAPTSHFHPTALGFWSTTCAIFRSRLGTGPCCRGNEKWGVASGKLRVCELENHHFHYGESTIINCKRTMFNGYIRNIRGSLKIGHSLTVIFLWCHSSEPSTDARGPKC